MDRSWIWIGVPVCSVLAFLASAGAAPLGGQGAGDKARQALPPPGEGNRLQPISPFNPQDVNVINDAAHAVPVAPQGTIQVAGTVNVGNFPSAAVSQTFQRHFEKRHDSDNTIFGCKNLELSPGPDFLLKSVVAARDQVTESPLTIAYLSFRVKRSDDVFEDARVRLHLQLATVPFGDGDTDQSGHLTTELVVRPAADHASADIGDVYSVELCIGRDEDDLGAGFGAQLFLTGTVLP
jgi:hypothetical protein